MTAVVPSVAAEPARRPLPRILVGGLAGGIVDFVYPTTMAFMGGKPLTSPWHAVASGWIGASAAREGGLATAALGVVTHFAIATCMAAAFVLATRRFPVLTRRPLASGAVYGLILYLIMYRVVLPLRWPEAFPSWQGGKSLLDIAAHVGVGLAIAWAASRDDRAINPKPGAAASV